MLLAGLAQRNPKLLKVGRVSRKLCLYLPGAGAPHPRSVLWLVAVTDSPGREAPLGPPRPGDREARYARRGRLLRSAGAGDDVEERKLGAGEAADGGEGVEGEASAVLGDAEPERICAELVHAGIGVRAFGVAAPSLEDLFVGLTGEGFDV